MANRGFIAALMVVLIMAVCTEVVWCRGGEAKESMNLAVDWARDRFSEGLGINQDTTQKLMDKAGDAASRATGTLNSAASESSEYISEKAGEMGSLTSKNTNEAIKRASNKANDAKESMQHVMGYGKADEASDADSATMTRNWKLNEMEEAYEEALKRVGQSYGAAKDTMNDRAKSTYEAAKEKASEVTGNLGSEMRKGTAEL